MPYSVKGFFEIKEDIVQILLMLEVLFIQDFKVEDLFYDASSGSGPRLRFNNYLFNLGLKPVQDDFQHDFADLPGADCEYCDVTTILMVVQF